MTASDGKNGVGAPPLKPGANPREALENHRERGPKRFNYTWSDLADVTGLAVRTLQQYASQGKFDPESLQSVVDYVFLRREKDASVDHQAEFELLQKTLGCGLVLAGVRSDGNVVVSLSHLSNGAFRETKFKVEEQLIKQGYVRSRWPGRDGKEVEGWAQKSA